MSSAYVVQRQRTLLAELSSVGLSSVSDFACDCRSKDDGTGPVRQLAAMRSVTFLRLIPDMMSPEYQDVWFRFMHQMQQISTHP